MENIANNILRCVIIKPKKEIPEIVEINLAFPLEDINKIKEDNEKAKTFDDDLRELLNIKDGKLPMYAALAMPLQNYLMAINPDMLSDDSDYNFGYMGSPIYNNVLIIETKLDPIDNENIEDENVCVKLTCMEEKTAEVLCTFFEVLKKEERMTGIYDSIVNEIKNIGKAKFLENIVSGNVEAGNISNSEEEDINISEMNEEE